MRHTTGIVRQHQGSRGLCRPPRGFTLLELILVIFFISLMLGLSSLLFVGTLSSSRLNSTAREISATIKYARSLSLLKGERQTVIFDLDAREYELLGKGSKKLPPDITIKAIDPLSGEIAQGKYQIICYPAGFIEGGTVEISNAKHTLRIELDPVLGSVSVKL